jgi:hypothetical protein
VETCKRWLKENDSIMEPREQAQTTKLLERELDEARKLDDEIQRLSDDEKQNTRKLEKAVKALRNSTPAQKGRKHLPPQNRGGEEIDPQTLKRSRTEIESWLRRRGKQMMHRRSIRKRG